MKKPEKREIILKIKKKYFAFQVNALMHALIELRKQNPAIKSLVVSQFTKFLSVIETPLK